MATAPQLSLTRLAILVALVIFLSVTLVSAAPQQSPNASIEGIVVRRDTGEALTEVHVELNTAADATRVTARAAMTGTDGKFTFENIPPGTYRLVAAREGGYLPAEYGQRSPNGAGLPIKLDPGQK